MLKPILLVALLPVFVAAAAAPTSKPSPNDKLKIVDHLMLKQSTSRPADAAVDHIVLHFCSDVIQHPDHPYDIDRITEIFSKAPASANYLIARDGTVYRLVPEERTAWHAGGGHLPWAPMIKQMNGRSIGIEMFAVGSENDMKLFGMKDYDAWVKKHPQWVGFSDQQYASLAKLIAQIESRHPQITHDRFHVIGHEEWAGRGRRTDPGELFDWTKIGLTKDRPTTQPSE